MARSSGTLFQLHSVAFGCISRSLNPHPPPSPRGRRDCRGAGLRRSRLRGNDGGDSLLHADEGAIPGTEWLSGVRRSGKTFNSLPFPSISTHFGRELGGFTLILAIFPQGRWDLQGAGDARFPPSWERRREFAVATHAFMVRDGWGYGARGSCHHSGQGAYAGLTGCLRDVQHLSHALPLCDSYGRPCCVGQDDGRQGAR